MSDFDRIERELRHSSAGRLERTEDGLRYRAHKQPKAEKEAAQERRAQPFWEGRECAACGGLMSQGGYGQSVGTLGKKISEDGSVQFSAIHRRCVAPGYRIARVGEWAEFRPIVIPFRDTDGQLWEQKDLVGR